MELNKRLEIYEKLQDEYDDEEENDLDLNVVLLSLAPMVSKALGKLSMEILM
jgi:hypothetical protein